MSKFKNALSAQAGQKAFLPHPALSSSGVSSPLIVNGPDRVRGSFGQKEASRHLQAYGGENDAIDWVMNCISLIVEKAGNADWRFEKNGQIYLPESKRGLDTPAEVKDAPFGLAQLFEQPNPYMGYEELIELTLIDWLLTGNAYWLKWRTNSIGQPLALYRLSPAFIKVVPGTTGPKEYTYDVPGFDTLKIPLENIMHFRRANPHSIYYGLGVIQGGARMLDLELALTDTQASYFEKRAQPSMVVASDRRVPKDVMRRLGTQLRAMYSGPKNAGAMMVLEAGLRYQSISPSAQDAMFEALTKLSRDRILAMFRVPGSMLGISDGLASTTPEKDQRIFDENTMKPMLKKLSLAITRGITSLWDMEFKIEYDYLMPPEERIRLSSSFAVLPGVRVREVRAQVGLDPLGDWQDDIVLNLPGDNGVTGNERNGHPDNNLAGEKGRPPLPSNTVAFPDKPENMPSTARVSLAAASKKSIEESLQTLEDILDKKAVDPKNRIKPPKDVLQADREAEIDFIVDDLTKVLNGSLNILERQLLDELEKAVEGKAPGDRIRSRLRASSAWTSFTTSLNKALEKAAKATISTATVQQGELNNRPEEEIDYEQIAKEVINRKGGLRKIVANFKNSVSSKVNKALDEGQTKDDIVNAIRDAVNVWRDGHAKTIALTEATHAYNEGVLTVAELTGYDLVYVHDGDEHDEPCRLANGQIWTIEEARANRLEHPNCRRAFTPVTPE